MLRRELKRELNVKSTALKRNLFYIKNTPKEKRIQNGGFIHKKYNEPRYQHEIICLKLL